MAFIAGDDGQMFSRAMLRSLPEIVQRTRALKDLPLSKISDPEALVYLHEAANCYITGLFLATVALSQETVENRLRQVCAKHKGKEIIAMATSDDLIHRFAVAIVSKSE